MSSEVVSSSHEHVGTTESVQDPALAELRDQLNSELHQALLQITQLVDRGTLLERYQALERQKDQILEHHEEPHLTQPEQQRLHQLAAQIEATLVQMKAVQQEVQSERTAAGTGSEDEKMAHRMASIQHVRNEERLTQVVQRLRSEVHVLSSHAQTRSEKHETATKQAVLQKLLEEATVLVTESQPLVATQTEPRWKNKEIKLPPSPLFIQKKMKQKILKQ